MLTQFKNHKTLTLTFCPEGSYFVEDSFYDFFKILFVPIVPIEPSLFTLSASVLAMSLTNRLYYFLLSSRF